VKAKSTYFKEQNLRALIGPGESTTDNAPVLSRGDAGQCIPQHFLRYAHTVETVEAVIEKIDYDPRYPIFVSQDGAGIFLQIGIVGPDNYKNVPDKLVYGRRWRVEPNLPTSEIIQTVFLAIKKAREHEMRERFVWSYAGRKTTPFNSHHDLPYMARNPQSFIAHNPLPLSNIIAAVRYDGMRFLISHCAELPSGETLLTLAPRTQMHGEFSGLCKDGFSVICRDLRPTTVLHAIFEACLRTSDAHVEEHFRYDGFARFSHNVDVLAISDMSADTRQCPSKYLPKDEAEAFISTLTTENYETDQTRIPVLLDSPHNRRIDARLSAMQISQRPSLT
jgi:hypothetical protein